MAQQQKEFIIDGKMYSTAEALLLYSFETPMLGKLKIYRTNKGAFFTVEEGELERTQVKVIDSDTARKLMNKNPAGIVNANYIKVFGKVQKG